MPKIPYGGLAGGIAVALIAAVSYLLGAFWFYGLDFLQAETLPIALIVKLVAVPTCLGVAYHYALWSYPTTTMAGKIPEPPRVKWRVDIGDVDLFTRPDTIRVLVILTILLIGFSLVARDEVYCWLVRAPLFGFSIFFPALCQYALVHALRRKKMAQRAFGAMLIFDAIVLANAGQAFAAEDLRRGRQDYSRNVNVSERVIAATEDASFLIDYGTSDFVMRTQSADPAVPAERRRSFSDILCVAAPQPVRRPR
jgi:hypothetical protein